MMIIITIIITTISITIITIIFTVGISITTPQSPSQASLLRHQNWNRHPNYYHSINSQNNMMVMLIMTIIITLFIASSEKFFIVPRFITKEVPACILMGSCHNVYSFSFCCLPSICTDLWGKTSIYLISIQSGEYIHIYYDNHNHHDSNQHYHHHHHLSHQLPSHRLWRQNNDADDDDDGVGDCYNTNICIQPAGVSPETIFSVIHINAIFPIGIAHSKCTYTSWPGPNWNACNTYMHYVFFR